MMRPPLGTVEKYTFKSTGMGMTTAGRTGSADPSLRVSSGAHGGGMMGMVRKSSMQGIEKGEDSEKKDKRQMGGMMGGSTGGMMSMKDATWTHAMHVHLVVSYNCVLS
jgi:hypothetical protein